MELNRASDLKDLLNVLEGVKKKWFLIGLQLGISFDKLIGFHGEDYPLLLMIMEWFNCDSPPTKAALVMALRRRCVGENRLAGEIERSTLGQHTTRTTGGEVITSMVHTAEESGRSTLEQHPPSHNSGYLSEVENLRSAVEYLRSAMEYLRSEVEYLRSEVEYLRSAVEYLLGTPTHSLSALEQHPPSHSSDILSRMENLRNALMDTPTSTLSAHRRYPTPLNSGYSSAVETSNTPTSTLSDDNGPTLETQDSFASEGSSTYSQGTFPHLETDMSPLERAILEARLITDSQKIQKLFGDLVNAIKSSLEKHSCPKKIIAFLSEYNFFALTKSATKKMLLECLPELAAAETVIDIFTVIRPFYSFFHYDLITTIIEKCCAGNDDLKEQLKNYESELKEFCKRNAKECPAGTFGTEGEPEENEIHLVVKMKGDFKMFTLETENVFRLKLCIFFGVKPSALRFTDASEGCIRLVFSLPSFLEEAIFPLSDQQKESLHGEGVMLLRSNQTEQFCDREELEKHDTLCQGMPTGEMAQPTVDLDSQSTTEDLIGSTGDSFVRSKEANQLLRFPLNRDDIGSL